MPVQMKFKCIHKRVSPQVVNILETKEEDQIQQSETETEDKFSEVEFMDPHTKERKKHIQITKVPKMVTKRVTKRGWVQQTRDVLDLQFSPIVERDPTNHEDFDYSSKYLGGGLTIATLEVHKADDYEVGGVYYINVTP